MANGGRIDFTVGFKTDSSGLQTLKTQLAELSQMSQKEFFNINSGSFSNINEAKTELQEVKSVINQVSTEYDKAFDSTTGVININKLANSLNKIGIDKISNSFNAMGVKGTQALQNINAQITKANFKFKETNNFLSKMGETLTNTIKWGIASSAINKFTGAIQQAWGYVQHLDTSLNDIRIVTDKSAEEMDKFAVKANDAAKALGSSTTEYTEAALIYYQQGLSDEESQARAETTLKAANVTGQTGREVSEELTAVWNGYKVSAEETELYVDKLAAVAASTASDLEELSTGMSKVASAANNMGVDVDQLNAQLATIISVTRQAPETAGTALKTIYARMEDLKIDGSDEDGVKLGEVSSTLDEVGVHIMDTEGNMRDLGEVIEEVGNKWEGWTDAQQSAIAQAIAGKRQYNNLLALFDNWDMYNSSLETSANATGTLQHQQDIYMESTAAHIQELKTEWEDFYDSLLDTDDINSVVDILTAVLDKVTTLLDSIGGGKALLTGLIGVLTKIPAINNVISSQIGDIINKNSNNVKNNEAWVNILKEEKSALVSGNATLKQRKSLIEQMSKNSSAMTDAQKQEGVALLENLRVLGEQKEVLDSELNDVKEITQASLEAGLNSDNFQLGNDESYYRSNLEGADLTSESSVQAITELFENQDDAIQTVQEDLEIYENKLQEISEAKEEYQNTLESLDEGSAEYEAIYEQYGQFLDDAEKEVQELKNEIQDGLNVISPSAKGEVEELNKKLDNVEENLFDIDVKTRPLEQDFNNINANMTKVATTSQQTHNLVVSELNDYSTKIHGINIQIAEGSALSQEFSEKLAAAAKGEGITNLVQGVSSLVFSFQSLSNIGNIINDDNLTAFEKFTQTVTALTFGLPMLKAGIDGLTIGFSKLITPVIANVAAQHGWIDAEGLATAQSVYWIGATEGETVATGQLTLALIGEKIAALAATGALVPLAAVFGVVTVAVVALTSALIVSAKAHKDEIEAIEKSNEASIEASKARQEEIKGYEEAADSLQGLIDKYKEGTISQQEFNEQKTELLANLDAEGRAALNVGESWEEATRALSNYRATLAKQNAEEAANQARMSAENALITADKGAGYYDTSTQTFSNSGFRKITQGVVTGVSALSPGIGSVVSTGYLAANKDYNDSLKQIDFYLQDTKTKLDDIIDESGNLQLDINNPQSIVDFVDAVDKASQAGVKLDESLTKQASEIRSSGAYADLTASLITEKTETEKAYGEESGINYAETLEEGQAAYDKFTSNLIKKEGYTLQEANDAWVSYLSGLDTEVATQMVGIQTNFDTMTSAFAKKFQGDFDASRYKAEADEVLQYLTDNNLTEGIHLFTPEEWEDMIIGNMSVEEIGQAVSSKLNQSIQDAFETFKETSGEKEDNLQSLITDAIGGSVDTSEGSVYATIKSQLKELTTYYPELQDEVNTFNNESIIGTQQWIDSVYTLKDAYNDLEFDKLIQEYSDDLEKLHNQIDAVGEDKLETTEERDENGQLKTEYIEVEADPKKFSETMSEIMDDDYSITVEIEGDITDDFDNLVDSMENMDSMAEKIGEDFIVSAEDITEVAAAYPGILEGYTDLGDGTIQLNEDIAKSAMNAASQAEIASTEELTTEIENTNAKLKLKKNHYQTIIDIAQKAADGEIDAQKASTDISAELDEIEEINNDLKSEEVENNAADVADNSAINAGIVSDNWGQAYDNMASDAIESAKVAIQAAKAVADEDLDAVNKLSSDVSVAWSGGSKGTTSGIDTSTSSYKGSSETTDSDYWQSVIDDAQANIDAIDEAIASNEAMAVEAAARLGSSVTTNSNVGSSDDDSSSSSEDEAETEEYLEREEDLYKAINEQLDEIEAELGRIETIQDHTWGINYANNLESQNELLKEQIDLLEEKKDTYESDLANQQATLSSYGITFSEDGSTMTNTEDVLNSLYDEYNSMVDSYNSMSADAQDSYQDTLDSKKETIEDIEDAIDDYESAYSDYNSVLDELLDTHYELIENEVKSFNAKIDVQLELDEAEQEWNDFWYEVVQDVDDTDFSGKIAQSIGKLNTLIGTVGDQQESQVATLTQHLNNTIEEVNKQIAGADNGGGDSIFGDDTALSKETLEDYRDKLMEAVRTAKEEIDEMAETYLDALESAKDLLDDQIDGWEAIGDHIEHNIELIQLVSGEKAYDALNMQFEQQYNNTLNLIETQRMSTEYWKERMEYYEDMMATEEEGSKMYDTYAEALKKASENYRDAVNDLDKAIEDALKDLEEWRKNQVAAISDALDNALSKNMGLEDLKKQWDLVIEEQDYYLDNVERAMEMEGLNDAFNEVLDGLQGRNDLQKEFLKFQNDEVQKLNEKNKLTQYDIDEVKARLEIKKQELALEEAQQNKSNLRLRRDSQGNYTYQYTANEEDVEEAENGILTAKQEWYELVKRRNEETTNEVIDIRKRLLEAENEMAEALAAHNDEAYNNAKERYEFLINYMTELMGEGEKTKQDFYKGTAEFFADVNNSQILPMWDTTVQGMIDAWSGDGETSFLGSTKKAIEDLETVQDKFSQRTEEILERAGVKYEDLVNDGIDPTTEALEDMVDTNEELNDTLEETNSTLTELETNLQAAIEAYNSLKDAAVDAINEANSALNTLASTAVSAINQINNATGTATSSVKATASSATGGSTSSSGGSSGNGSSSSTKSSSTKYKVVDDPNGAENTYALKNLDTGKYVAIQGNLTSKNAAKVYWSDLDEKYRNNIYYDTGGYTGEWTNGSERKNGRLAVLHQKELVLNESDTSNLLSAVNAVRSLVNGSKETNFDSLADSVVNMAQMQTSALANISSSMLQALASMVVNNNSDVSNYRNMTVNADFSGVQSADAIYQALMELDNYGTQQSYSEAPLANTRY